MNVTSETFRPATESALAPLIQEALERLETATGPVTLDFSSVQRLETAALPLLGRLAARARVRGVQLILRDVNVAVYKALKLSGLAPQFSFLR